MSKSIKVEYSDYTEWTNKQGQVDVLAPFGAPFLFK
jgi:hypothetical protein